MDLAANILVSKSLQSKEEGRKLLEMFLRHFPRHVPDRFDDHEPLRHRFDPGNLDAALEAWNRHGFLAERRRKPKMLLSGRIAEPQPKPHFSKIGLLEFQTDQSEELAAMTSFIYEASEVFEADYAVAHILTHGEFEDRLEALSKIPRARPDIMREKADSEGFAATLWGMAFVQHNGLTIRKYLPDLCWLTVFGLPYVEMFGRENLLATPAHEVRELSTGAVGIKLTPAIEDTADGWARFKAVSDRCKVHLGSDAFLDRSKTSQVYRVPKFKFPVEMYKPRSPKV